MSSRLVRLVLDTNVVATPRSAQIREEDRLLPAHRRSARRWLRATRLGCGAVATPRIAPDPDDDVVVGTALAAMAELIVTGDKPLLAVASHQGVRIVGVAQAIEDIEAMTPRATEKPGGGDAAS